ncbi:DUF3169 family protein [Streptococcus caviae]|uniref:DUF3169 family protein n=1 Tax=Streptococcus sp. 'caviae' TaxID=1915004 RepID=UPI00094BC64C|nr:DUF3169 family protein [Streptococcus sp. 'caviae']OLN84140.1 hypothetical protein BMI76_02790 [Streptococcus sp. 'caviae']
MVKKRKGTFKRAGKRLLIGASIGGLGGALIGYFHDSNQKLPLSQKELTEILLVSLRILFVIAFVLSIFYIVQVLQAYKDYQKSTDDESEELYRTMNKRHSYAVIYAGVSGVSAALSVILAYKLIFADSYAELFFPILDFLAAMASGALQTYVLKVYNRIRNLNMPLVPTLKELKNNVMQMDEAELEANYKISFEIVMNLSGIILPGIYLALFLLSLALQKVELTGLMVAAVIHLYIMGMQFKMTKAYYK